MNANDTMICWTPARGPFASRPTRGRMALVPWPDFAGHSDGYAYTDLACFADTRRLTPTEQRHMVMSIALGAILRDGLDPAEVHRALWPLAEFRDALPPDVPAPALDRTA